MLTLRKNVPIQRVITEATKITGSEVEVIGIFAAFRKGQINADQHDFLWENNYKHIVTAKTTIFATRSGVLFTEFQL